MGVEHHLLFMKVALGAGRDDLAAIQQLRHEAEPLADRIRRDRSARPEVLRLTDACLHLLTTSEDMAKALVDIVTVQYAAPARGLTAWRQRRRTATAYRSLATARQNCALAVADLRALAATR